MNVPVLIVACIMLLAFVAHVFGGTRQTASIEPSDEDSQLSANWVQSMCAFQMLSVDLLAVGSLLFAVAVSDLGAVEPIVIQLAIGLFLLWGIVWIVQVVWLKKPNVGLIRLPHWVVWFACAALLVWGLSY